MKSAPRTAYLSPREVEVLTLVGLCHSTKEIADYLAISRKTVEKHRGRCCEALGVSTCVELVYRAIQLGLVTVNRTALCPHRNGKILRYCVPALEAIRA